MVNHGLDTDEQVFFYEQEFYVLSNFSAFEVRMYGEVFKTAEHLYHWSRFPGLSDKRTDIRDRIKNATSAHNAYRIAQTYKEAWQIPEWDSIKVHVMRDILIAKAEQHEYVARKLEETGNRVIIENSWRDDFWGWGESGMGLNQLGTLWMEVRAMRRANLAEQIAQLEVKS